MEHSNIIIKDNSILISRNLEKLDGDLTGVVHIMGGLSIEIGRHIQQFMNALAHTRLPIVLQKRVDSGNFKTYQVIRLNTGAVPNINLGYIETFKGTITGFIYDTDIIINKKLRKYVKTSVLNMLAIKKEGRYLTKIERVLRLILKTDGIIKVKANEDSSVVDMIVHSKVYKYPIVYRCVLGKTGDRYTFKSVTLAKTDNKQ